jgi:Zn-dependent peptidase ImmA (M78 family)
MNLSRMDLADFGSPDRIVNGILVQAPDMPIPVPVDDIARMLDIVDIRTVEMQGFEGGLITDQSKSEGVILVNEASSRQRRRFTIGHELGHFLCPTHLPPNDSGFRCTSADMRRSSASNTDRAAQMEVEANRFSAALLLPLPLFRKDLRQRRGTDLEHVLGLAKRYDMSKEATARRYVEVHDEPCAVVISRNGVILRIYRGNDFPYVALSKNDRVPAQSVTARLALEEGLTSDWEDTDAALWLPSDRGRRLPSMFEQALVQQNGFRLTLLTIDAEADETAGEDEELEDSWTPRFRR